MADLCTDNRFELIEKYKKKLIEATNIEDSQDEMNVLGDILFRFWQMGWLDRLELTPRIEMLQDDTLMVEADEGQFEKVNRIILSYRTWCKTFCEDGDDTVDVVRCRDCKWNQIHITPSNNEYHICKILNSAFDGDDDFYCAYGERGDTDG